jgi:UDP-2,3-diacylglucosamine pyrophosphatase LpxH
MPTRWRRGRGLPALDVTPHGAVRSIWRPRHAEGARPQEEAPVVGEGRSALASAHYVVSDLHLSDGHHEHETWRAPQQAAWERFLRRIPAASEGAGLVELVVNGDCFDCLMAAPYLTTEDETTAVDGAGKIGHIIAAHREWFDALGAFLREPGRRVTFLIGNHDLELAFPAVRDRVRRALGAPAGAVRFCTRRAYRPLADVEIEHGCQFDPWNVIPGLWDGAASGAAAAPEELETTPGAAADPSSLRLPWGSRYYGRVFRTIQQRFPSYDAFAPGLPQPGILALVCLLAPECLVSSAAAALTLYDEPPAAAPDLAAAAEGGAAELYATLLPGMAALQAQVWRQADVPLDADDIGRTLGYIAGIQAGLDGSVRDAIRAIFSVPEPRDAGNIAVDATASAKIVARAPDTAFALCGHTHGERYYQSGDPDWGYFTYLNTGTWYPRLALPGPDDVNDALVAWLREPRAAPSHGRDAAAFSFAELRGAPGEPTTARLCQVGVDGW